MINKVFKFIFVLCLLTITSEAMIVRNKGEQAIAIKNAAQFPGVGVIGHIKPLNQEDITSLKQIYQLSTSSDPKEREALIETYLKEAFSEIFYLKLEEIIAKSGLELIPFLDQVILGQGVKVDDRLITIDDFYKLTLEESLGLAGMGTGTLVDPVSLGLDDKKYHNRLVLTAAHVVSSPEGRYVFRLQPQLNNPNVTTYEEYNISHVFIPSGYKDLPNNQASMDGYDVAIVVLDRPVTLPIQPIAFKDVPVIDLLGRTILTVGFGKTGYAGSNTTIDFIRRAGHFLINAVDPKTLIFGATSISDPKNYFYGSNPFLHSQVFFGHPYRDQAELTSFDYNEWLINELEYTSNDPNITHNIRSIAKEIKEWEQRKLGKDLQEVSLTYRYGPYKDQIIKYSRLPDVAVMTLSGDSGGPVLICEKGHYYVTAVIFAGDAYYTRDKNHQFKPAYEYCQGDDCKWADDYEKSLSNKEMPAQKNKNYSASSINSISHILPKLTSKMEETDMTAKDKFQRILF